MTIVCGPPGSGKSTYVRRHSIWGDLVIDLDAIFGAITGLPPYDKPQVLLLWAMEARDALYARLDQPGDLRAAWIVTSGARLADREQLRQRFHADVIVLEISEQDCLRHVQQDAARKARWQQWQPIIRRWWQQYERSDHDQRIQRIQRQPPDV